MIVGTIPARHSAHTLVGTMRWLREDPANRRVLPRSYAAKQMDLTAFEAWFRARLQEKINRNEPRRGRKDDPDWERAARHAARAVNTPRLIVRPSEVPAEFRARLAHRLYKEDD